MSEQSQGDPVGRINDEAFLIHPGDVGAQRFAQRPWPSLFGWVILTLPLGVILAVWTTIWQGVAVGAQMLVIGVAIALGMILPMLLAQHRVCERALVLGFRFPGAQQLVIPWSTVDIDRIRLHLRANRMGSRLGGYFERRAKQTLHLERTGPLSTKAITFPALAFDHASDRQRGKYLLGGGQTLRELEDELRWRRAREARPFPVATWIVGTPDPNKLLRAIEEAMVASGREEARGLAERVLANPVVECWRNPLTEEEIYGAAEHDDAEDSSS